MQYVILSQILSIMNSSEIHEHLNKLTQHSKQALIDKLYNFPVLPPEQQLQGKRQQHVLKEYFPWGCQKINQSPFFSTNDFIADARISDCTNICISIKYGICPFFSPESLKYIQHRLRQVKQVGGNLYVKLIQARDGDIRHDNVMALARVTEVNPYLTFRFWHIRPGKFYPIGVAKIEIVCVGYIKNSERSSLKRVYEDLKESQLEWKFLKAADNIQQVERHKYINAIKENKCQKLQQELREKNLSMLDLFNAL